MIDKEKVLIYIPADGNYIEILGYKIDGFESFEAFLEHLEKYAEMEEEIKHLKADKEGLINGQISLQKALAHKDSEIKRLSTLAELGNMRANDYRVMRDRALKAEAKVESKSAVMGTMARCIEIQDKEIERLKKLLSESEAKFNEAAKRFYKHGVKDFQEKLKKEALVDCKYVILPLETIDTVAKDLAGEAE